MKKTGLILLFLSQLHLLGQVGGTKVYSFLDIPMTARAAALGGSNMCFWGDDVQLLYSNPSLLNPAMSNQLAMDFSNYVSDMKFGYLAYAKSLKNKGTVAGSVQFFNYGNFNGYDELGQATASFKANDYSINLNYAKAMADTSFNIGIALKTIISQYDVYSSYGNAIDFGITYRSKNRIVLSILAKNIGLMWKNYTNTPNQIEQLPNDVQVGISYKVAKAPFRLFMVYDQLLRWNLNYVSPIDTAGQNNSLGGSSTQDTTGWQNFWYGTENFLDNFMRHVVFGTEIVITKNFNLRIAYNYRRQKEMTLPDKRVAAGLSVGFGFKVKRFGFSYAFNKMALPGNSSVFGVSLIL